MGIWCLNVVLHVWIEWHGHLRDHRVDHVRVDGGEVGRVVALHGLHLRQLPLELQSCLLVPPFILHNPLEELLRLRPGIVL